MNCFGRRFGNLNSYFLKCFTSPSKPAGILNRTSYFPLQITAADRSYCTFPITIKAGNSPGLPSRQHGLRELLDKKSTISDQISRPFMLPPLPTLLLVLSSDLLTLLSLQCSPFHAFSLLFPAHHSAPAYRQRHPQVCPGLLNLLVRLKFMFLVLRIDEKNNNTTQH